MADEIRENPKLLVIVLSTAVVAVAIFAIFMLVLVWNPKDNNKAVEQPTNEKLGTYTRVFMDEKSVVEKYCRNTLNIFASGDLNLINNMVLPEYLDFRGIEKPGLKAALTQKGVLGKILEFSSYSSITHPNYGKIFEVNIYTYDNTYSDKMLIIQKTPNDYKISFDGFIGYSKNTKSTTVDGLKLDINSIKELTTVSSISITLTNVSGHNITINKENNYENIYLKLTTGNEIRMNSTWLSGETKELTNGAVVNLNTEFITSGLSNGVAKSIIIKNIYDNLSKETKDIEFPIY